MARPPFPARRPQLLLLFTKRRCDAQGGAYAVGSLCSVPEHGGAASADGAANCPAMTAGGIVGPSGGSPGGAFVRSARAPKGIPPLAFGRW